MIMFKRKSNLPQRPKAPSANQILEDLSAAPDDDQFLNAAKNISSELSRGEESQARDAGYESVKCFLRQDQDLQNTMEELKAAYENLQACSAEITVLAEELKEQAVKALL